MATKRKQTRKHYENRRDSGDDFMDGVVEVEKVAIGGAIAVGTLGLLGGMMGHH